MALLTTGQRGALLRVQPRPRTGAARGELHLGLQRPRPSRAHQQPLPPLPRLLALRAGILTVLVLTMALYYGPMGLLTYYGPTYYGPTYYGPRLALRAGITDLDTPLITLTHPCTPINPLTGSSTAPTTPQERLP